MNGMTKAHLANAEFLLAEAWRLAREAYPIGSEMLVRETARRMLEAATLAAQAGDCQRVGPIDRRDLHYLNQRAQTEES